MHNDQKKPQTPITDHLRATGGWNPNWDSFAELDPVWTEKFMDAGATPFVRGAIAALQENLKTLEKKHERQL